MNKVATLLLCANFITVLFPQPGYIHPDEFFQSSEIVAGDVLQVIHYRAWEFNSTNPIRSIVFPYLMTAPSLHLLRWLNSTSFSGFKISAVKVVMATRLPVAFLNVFGYLATGKLADHFGAERPLSVVLWCSSYIFWSYFTRTFSNSIEAILLALVFLLCLSPALPSQGIGTAQGEKLKEEKNSEEESDSEKSEPKKDKDNSKKEKSSSEEERAITKDTKSNSVAKASLSSSSSSSGSITALKLKSIFFGILLTAGFFNRPTFLLFSFIPLLYWFSSECCRQKLLMERLALWVTITFYLLIGLILTFATFVTIDSIYYNEKFPKLLQKALSILIENPFSIDSLRMVSHIIISSSVVTPLNFLKYNTDPSNLAEHGIHPRYTHFVVNMPLLLGPLYVPFLAVCVSSLYLILRKGLKNMYVSNVWLVLMALTPVLGLSVFPHQEPRFLIPLLPVFIVTGVKIVQAMAHGRHAFFIMWVIFNVILHLVYGYLHQAAVIPALSIYQQRLSATASRLPRQTNHVDHMIFYKTYPPPRHLLLLQESRTDVEVHDLAGAPMKVLMKTVNGLERDMGKPNVKGRIFVFLPSTVSARFLDLLAESESNVSSSSICPHLSTESLPRFKQFWAKRITLNDFVMDFCLNIVRITAKSTHL